MANGGAGDYGKCDSGGGTLVMGKSGSPALQAWRLCGGVSAAVTPKIASPASDADLVVMHSRGA